MKHDFCSSSTGFTQRRIINSDFRGEMCVLLINHGESDFTVQRGDHIAQLILAPVLHAEFEEVEELEPSARGAGGFGSTG